MKVEVIFIAGYWRVMRDRKLVSTHRTRRQAEKAAAKVAA